MLSMNTSAPRFLCPRSPSNPAAERPCERVEKSGGIFDDSVTWRFDCGSSTTAPLWPIGHGQSLTLEVVDVRHEIRILPNRISRTWLAACTSAANP
jgi:hypothetical protein